jgi:tetratricopeptide (TPR) repeat protein
LATTLGTTESPAPDAVPANLPDYEVLGELGHGGMGVVYKARQISLNRVVALKMIQAGAHASPDLMARFQLEAEALASLQHPNIVQVYEVGTHDRCPYMALEFVDGGSLADLLHSRQLPLRAAAELVETLARAMHCAHQRGIIHRDLKPANVLLYRTAGRRQSEQGEGASDPQSPILSLPPAIPKITDFGLAKRLAEGKGQTATGAILGTPGYMAPEQAASRARELGPATDIYALGAVLYELITGRPPFPGGSSWETLRRVVLEEPEAPARLCPALPRDLGTICLKCLEKQPAKRYATAEALAEDLRRFLDGKPIAARSASAWERAWKWAKRRPAVAALLAVIVLAAAGLAASFGWSYGQVRGERDRARASLLVARRAVDDLYTKMATERLFDEPQLDPLCQELLKKAQELYERLAQEYSDDPALRGETALAWFRLGDIHRLQDHHEEAERAYNEAIFRQEALVRANPGQPLFRQELAKSHNWLGEVLREPGRPPDEPAKHYQKALELQQGLIQEFPSETSYRVELARSHYNLGLVEKDANQLPEARANYDRAVELLTALHQSGSSEPSVRQDLARALINRGVLRRLEGRPKEAEADYDKAIDLLGRLRDEFPARAIYKFERAIACQDRGNLLWSQGRHADALQQEQEALALLSGLVTNFSTRPLYKKKMGNALKNLGAVLASTGDRKGAEQCWNQARSLFEALARDDPGTADYHGLLGMTLGNLGWLRTDQKNWLEARRLIEQGIEQMRLALQPNPKHPDYLQELRSQCQDLAETLVTIGDHAAALKAATELAGVIPDQSQDGYYAACFVARCVPLALEDKKLDVTARQAAASRYVKAAVRLLQKAAANALPTLRRLPEEKQVFQPLENHPEFPQVLQQLNAKVPNQAEKPAP